MGCAVGVSAGILGLREVTGFDLFPDLLRTARRIDSLTGGMHRYVAADMTRDWPFSCAFDTVICGLVCHHLKEQADILSFFSSAARVLTPGGALVITLPSGTIAHHWQLKRIIEAIEGFGFEFDETVSGMILSHDVSRSLFWMFTLTFVRTSGGPGTVFVHPGFGFPEFRTPVCREEKGKQAKSSETAARSAPHTRFRHIRLEELENRFREQALVFSTISALTEMEHETQSNSRIDTTGL